MIIVSQDKKKAVQFNNKVDIDYDCTYDAILKKTEKFWIVFIDCEDIAHYKTEERAKEVFQEIINEYKKYATIQSPKIGIIEAYILPKVYEMPEE